MVQGSEEWLAARCGKITSSKFKDVMTRGKKKEDEFGKVALKYAHEIATEILTDIPVDGIKTQAMEWGIEHEPIARMEYQKKTFSYVKKEGFIVLHDRVGCSPDGLIGSEGGLEIKCPNSTTHLTNLLYKTCPKEYMPQVQGCMYCTGRKWWDFMSYDPRFPEDQRIMIVRVERDQAFIDLLEERIQKFIKIVDNILKKC